MLDWPGRIAATVFLAGCTMRCPYCHNPELVAGRKGALIALDDVLAHLYAKRGWIDGVVVTGGEPTMHADLIEILSAFADADVPVKLDTNGSRPQVLERILSLGLVDFVAMDVKAAPERYSAVTGLGGAWDLARVSIELIRQSGIAHEFRTTCYPLAVKPADLDEIAAHLTGANRFVIQQFRPARTLDPASVSVAPYGPEVLRTAAERCKRFLPTVVRGV
jgi:pyruvate formate lyase activating enzyme